MAEQKEFFEQQRRLKEWSQKVSLLWAQDAQKVIGLLEQGSDSVIVDGPWGSGKSMNLVPQIKLEVSRLGWYCADLDARKLAGIHRKSQLERLTEFENELSKFPQVGSSTSAGLMLLDESGVLETEETLSDFLTMSDKRGYKRTVVIPAGGTEGIRDEMTSAIQNVLSEKGKTTAVYKLERKLLPESLSREYFSIKETPTDVIDFIMPVFPMYPNVVCSIGGKKSVKGVLMWWENNKKNPTGYLRGLTKEDVELTDKQLGSFDIAH